MVAEAGHIMVQSNFKSIFHSDSRKKIVNVLNLVLEADDLLKIRKRVCELYVDKKVIIAPCLTKLYLSRAQQIIDCDGKTTPDWFYFGTGVVAIIYDAKYECLKIALFEERSTRLLWCMNWADYVIVQTQTSNFHILNTKADCTQHVGFLYENKDVADLMLDTLNLITSSATIEKTEACSRSESQNQIKSRQPKRLVKQSNSLDCGTQETSGFVARRRSSLRESLLRRAIRQKSSSPASERKTSMKQRSCTVIGTFSSRDSVADTESSVKQTKESSNTKPTKITNFTRANSFRNAVACNSIGKEEITKNQETNLVQTENQKSKRDSQNSEGKDCCERATENKEGIMKSIFRKRRISRSQSLKILSRKRDSQISQLSQSESLDDKKTLENNSEIQQSVNESITQQNSKQHQRSKKLVKPRSSTDSLLLRGEAIQNIIETGHVARFARQKRQIAKRLEEESLQSTDLCVTEL